MGWCSLSFAVRQLSKGEKRSRSGLARGSEESLTEPRADLGMEWEDNLRDSHPISGVSSVLSRQAKPWQAAISFTFCQAMLRGPSQTTLLFHKMCKMYFVISGIHLIFILHKFICFTGNSLLYKNALP